MFFYYKASEESITLLTVWNLGKKLTMLGFPSFIGIPPQVENYCLPEAASFLQNKKEPGPGFSQGKLYRKK